MEFTFSTDIIERVVQEIKAGKFIKVYKKTNVKIG